MITRIFQEKREYQVLSMYAMKAADSRGRNTPEKKCSTRTDFQRDRDRIVHSKSFRRLMHKTQVFISPEGDHYRTRLTHTIEVSQIARTIARGLGVNEDLTEAIAMGHDLGHTPFGHSGENVLNRIHPGGFKHNVQSLRVVDLLENNSDHRQGMNLTYEVRDGILNHTGKELPCTVEGQIVKISDRIAYINHDIDDALRSGIIGIEDLPKDCIEVLGDTHKQRIDTLVKDMISNSWNKPVASLTEEKKQVMNSLRSYMFENIYSNTEIKKIEDINRIDTIITSLYEYFNSNPELLPPEYFNMIDDYGVPELVKDYIAGMTDRYALVTFEQIFDKK